MSTQETSGSIEQVIDLRNEALNKLAELRVFVSDQSVDKRRTPIDRAQENLDFIRSVAGISAVKGLLDITKTPIKILSGRMRGHLMTSGKDMVVVGGEFYYYGEIGEPWKVQESLERHWEQGGTRWITKLANMRKADIVGKFETVIRTPSKISYDFLSNQYRKSS